MAEISLTQNKVAIVDDADYSALNKWKWWVVKKGRTYYAVRKKYISGKYYTIYMHRQMFDLNYGDEEQIDHINGDGLDNRRNNLRKCTRQQNHFNRQSFIDRSSKHKGVYWAKHANKWCAMIQDPYTKKNKNLGYFDNEIDAAIAFDLAAIKFHGQFARLNFSRIPI